ncbi:MAG: type II secretion system F family protein [Planctomycetaceae bacterium]|nr:type II secretion system F family protein [Planctomycetaceae bacterium]
MAITLEDIQHLSDEIRSLVQAGLPLEGNLADAGSGHRPQLQRLTEQISQDLASGRSLQEIVNDDRMGVPRILQAAVAAGVESGQLSSTIEMLGDVAADLSELRRRILQALSYPLTVMAMAVILFVVFIRTFLDRVRMVVTDFHRAPETVFDHLLLLDERYSWWPIIFPAALLFWIVLWLLSGRASAVAFRGPERVFLLLPGVRGLIRDLRFYTLSRMLNLLVHRETPLPDALVLSGACVGDRHLDRACQNLAEQLQRGNIPEEALRQPWVPGRFPPLLAAGLKQSGTDENQLRERLESITGYYRRRLQISMTWMKNVVPVLLFFVVGGGAVLLYSTSMFWSISELYRQLSDI